MMGNKKPTYEELERRLTDAEAIIATLHRGEVDAIISERTVALLRVAELEEALRRSEENFRNSLERSPLGVCIVTAEEEILYANQAMLDICGYSSVDELKAVPIRDHYTTESFAEHQEREEKRKRGDFVPSDYEKSIMGKDGVVRHLAVSRAEVTWNGQRQFEALYQDITERKKAQEALHKAHIDLEERVQERTAELEARTEELKGEILERQKAEKSLHRLNRAYRMVCECTQVLIRITDEKSLLDKICRIIIEMGGYRLAWVGLAEFDDNKTVRPVASAGFEKGYLESINVTWADEPKGRGPTGTAIRTGQLTIARNIPTDPHFAPWRRRAIKRGYASSIALPLRMDHENMGALNIYAAEPEAFDEEEVDLLINLADNLAYGIASLRTRAERNRAEEALRESEGKYRSLVESTDDAVYLINRDMRYEFANGKYLSRLGLSLAELVGQEYGKFHPWDTNDEFVKKVDQVIKSGKPMTYEYLSQRDNKYFMRTLSPVTGKKPGEIKAITVTSKDITDRKRAEAELEATQEQLRNLSTHLQSVREEDRASLAREIHDELGQALMVLKFGLLELKNALPADKISLVEKITSMAEYIDATAQTVNKIATQLRPTLLDELGLVEAIEWEVEQFEDRTGIKCELMVEPEEMVVDRDRSTAIYRVVQEALTNIARHAQTTRSAVSLKMSDGKLNLSITDNGIGITEDKVLNPKALGIIGMRERVLSVGGNFKINGIKDRGTKIRVIIPVKVENKVNDKNSYRG